MNRKQRPYDIILLGATGFTGQLTAEYLLKQAHPIKLALAGRNAEKLEQVCESLLADNPQANKPDLLVADNHNMASLKQLCAQTKVVISTVGPYTQHGEDLIA
ncbi:MAG: saccharopine dehydrogenase NADP-binding domain-containing protein, partial [Pseudomonadales bacterium]|nr:saccharopine dehydrogenase NADP-binding domain-containing protein [Pseudomonadales bacterium]